MTKKELFEALKELFENDENLFIETIEELDSYNGYLYDDRYYSMYDFDELMSGKSPTEIIESISLSDFSTGDDYFKYTIYGIESSSCKDYSDYLDTNFLETLLDYYHKLNIDLAIVELIEAYEENEEES